jgi:hypothetical protein
MDRRTSIFLFLTSSVCLCTALCLVGSLGIPYVKRLNVIAYRGAVGSALPGFSDYKNHLNFVFCQKDKDAVVDAVYSQHVSHPRVSRASEEAAPHTHREREIENERETNLESQSVSPPAAECSLFAKKYKCFDHCKISRSANPTRSCLAPWRGSCTASCTAPSW